MKETAPKKFVVMGGGTGTFPIVRAAKHLNVELASIIAVSDSGGSTARLRDEFGFQPVGDLRQALAALAESDSEEWIRKILLYRFSKGEGLQGHNLGNLLLTALQDMTDDTTKALEIAEQVFHLEGRIIPVTQANVNLKIHYQDGSVVEGEHTLDEKTTEAKKIDHVSLTPAAKLNPVAKNTIEAADIIIIGPGDYYASLMATLLPSGIRAAFAKTAAKIVYMVNLMTRFTQTHNMTAHDHVVGIEAAIGRPVDLIVIHDQSISDHVQKLYAAEQEYPVRDDLGMDKRVIRADVVSPELMQTAAQDAITRSLLRHDVKKVQHVLEQLVK